MIIEPPPFSSVIDSFLHWVAPNLMLFPVHLLVPLAAILCDFAPAACKEISILSGGCFALEAAAIVQFHYFAIVLVHLFRFCVCAS
jgi:hypothetical protein